MNQDEILVSQLPRPVQVEPIVITTGSNFARIEFPAKKGKPPYRVNPAMTFWQDP
jgi:hypothetical protein